ncbi:shikimate dehydrogenase [Anaerobacillus sp. MEB173]|uniref:shikimate dehydrogenase n=1 Tax=Anaerobacillus sp. MEB173 TaxID=3383345 RepID=UPI003F9184DC
MGKLFGLFGHPVGHSMSPTMHNDAFANLGLSHYYQAFDVREENLETAVKGVRALGISGFNVTIPHKVAIMQYLDEIDTEAEIIGAVNTVVLRDNKLIGYNTDGIGYVRSLLELVDKEELKQKSILVIGAGGAARAIVTSMLRFGAQNVSITNRTIEKAEELVEHCRGQNMKILSLNEAEKGIDQFEVIINTTSVGMSPNIDEIPLAIENIKKGTILSDIVYNPLKTKWLALGEEKGAIIHNGVGMFVYQGAEAFEMWTDSKPDYARMKEIVMKRLGG